MADHDQTLQKSTGVEDAMVDDDSKGVVAAENPTNYQESEKQLEFSEDEETLIIRMHNLVGERWSLIAGRIPGRNAEEIEKYWNSRHSKPENSNFGT